MGTNRQMSVDEIEKLIRNVPDFPKPGIVYKDITPVLEDGEAFRNLVEMMASSVSKYRPQRIIGIESRGFILGSAISYVLGCGLSLVRKAGKLPSKTIRQTYELEYGTDHVEIHEDALQKSQRVIIVDDVLATGGTAHAALKLCQSLGAEVLAIAVFIELAFLEGRKNLNPTPIHSLIRYERSTDPS